MMENIQISVVVPVFNEAGNIRLLVERTLNVLQETGRSFEIILVDDGSKDDTFSVIRLLQQQHGFIKGISLSRNFGHQVALTAGLEHASGELVISMDGDLQHPPELIPELLAEQQKGFDIVNTIRRETSDATAAKNASAGGFYKLMNKISDVEIVPGAADFRLMSRRAVDAFLQIPERDRFTRGLISWMGFRQSFIHYTAARRHSGQSKYTFRKMLRFAWDGITAFSSRPLRISFYVGLIAAGMGVIYAIYALINRFVGHAIEGWTSLLIVVLVMGGIQLISIGIIGEYLARVFNESKARPLYFVKDMVGDLKKSEKSRI